MSDQPVASLVTTKSDAELAAEYRRRIGPIMDQVREIVGEARSKHGLIIGFNIGPDQFGRIKVLALDITKSL